MDVSEIKFDQETIDGMREPLHNLLTKCLAVADEMNENITGGEIMRMMNANDPQTSRWMRAEAMKAALDRFIVNSEVPVVKIFSRTPQGVKLINEILTQIGSPITLELHVTHS